MAKTKISEIMKTYGVEKEELASFLKEKGVEVKTTGSSVDEDTMKLVEARFGKKAEPSQKNDKSSETADSSSDGQKVVRKVVTPVKKKKIIFLSFCKAETSLLKLQDMLSLFLYFPPSRRLVQRGLPFSFNNR